VRNPPPVGVGARGSVDLKKHYDEISEAARLVREDSLRDPVPLLAAHAVVDEIRIWKEILGARPEASIFDQIVSGLELGLFALVSGLYRQAYGSLRLAVELTAGVCWFSTHRLDLAEWQSGERDLIWKEITNDEEGVLSPRFRKAFFPELNEERKYNGLNKKLYRELSEYVHGSARTWAGPDDIKFDEKLHQAWFEKLDTYMVVTMVLLSLRYLQEVGDEAVARLAPKLHSRVGHVSAITKYLEERLPTASAPAPATAAEPATLPASPAAAGAGDVPTPPAPETNGAKDVN
jgi:hypothetical protein